MADKSENWLVRLGRWAWQKLTDNLAATFFIVMSGGVGTWVASATAILAPYAPVSWLAVGLVAALIVASCYALYATSRRWLAETKFEELRQATLEVNPLDQSFSRKRIKLQDFFHPYFKPNRNIVFRHCELFGPAIVFVEGCSFENPIFKDCDFVIARDNSSSNTSTAFKGCVFERCDFYHVMFVQIQRQWNEFNAAVPHLQPFTYQRPTDNGPHDGEKK